MREPFTQLFVHLVWATWDREPLITEAIREPMYACILSKCHGLGAELLAIGGMEDHVHVLVRIPTTVSIADLVKHIKGASSHLVNQKLTGHGSKALFKWQGAYGAFTVSKSNGRQVREYILNQVQHHTNRSTVNAWELNPGPEF
jgi:REP element-mobilizing transposase RayT